MSVFVLSKDIKTNPYERAASGIPLTEQILNLPGSLIIKDAYQSGPFAAVEATVHGYDGEVRIFEMTPF